MWPFQNRWLAPPFFITFQLLVYFVLLVRGEVNCLWELSVIWMKWKTVVTQFRVCFWLSSRMRLTWSKAGVPKSTFRKLSNSTLTRYAIFVSFFFFKANSLNQIIYCGYPNTLFFIHPSFNSHQRVSALRVILRQKRETADQLEEGLQAADTNQDRVIDRVELEEWGGGRFHI